MIFFVKYYCTFFIVIYQSFKKMDRSGYVSRANELLKVHEESKYQAFFKYPSCFKWSSAAYIFLCASVALFYFLR